MLGAGSVEDGLDLRGGGVLGDGDAPPRRVLDAQHRFDRLAGEFLVQTRAHCQRNKYSDSGERDQPRQHSLVPRRRFRRRIHLARIAGFSVVDFQSCRLTEGRSITLWRTGAHPSTPTAICAAATTSACRTGVSAFGHVPVSDVDAGGSVGWPWLMSATWFMEVRRWIRSPWLLNMVSSSTGRLPAGPNQWGTAVSKSAASPGVSVRSCSPRSSRRRPLST